jgi:hypothetical protein
MVYAENWSQPSIFELARSGNFQALNYWIDSLLRPEGIYARVEQAQAGCVQILVEFQRGFAPENTLLGSTLETQLASSRRSANSRALGWGTRDSLETVSPNCDSRKPPTAT